MPPKKIGKIKSQLQSKQIIEETDEGENANEETQVNMINYQKNIISLKRRQIHKNNKINDINSRTYSSLCSGIAAGVFGLSGANGIFFYLIMFFLISFLYYLKYRNNLLSYFKTKNEVLLQGVSDNLLLYITTWIVLYNLVWTF